MFGEAVRVDGNEDVLDRVVARSIRSTGWGRPIGTPHAHGGISPFSDCPLWSLSAMVIESRGGS